MTFDNFISRWYDIYKRPFLAANSNRNNDTARGQIPPALLSSSLSDLDPLTLSGSVLDVYRAHGERAGQLYAGFIRQAVRAAYTLGYIPRDISPAVLKPQHKQQHPTALTLDELRALISAARAELGADERNGVLLCALLGLRRG